MKNYDLNKHIERTHTASVKWDDLQQKFPLSSQGALPLWVADMDFACCEEIQKALHTRVDQQIYGYTSDIEGYHDSVVSWFQRHFQWHIQKQDIFFSPGVVSAIAFLIRILSKEGDGIIIQNPVYYPFARNIILNKRKVIDNPLLNDHGYYTMDYADLEEKLSSPNTAGMILCSPHNPVGRVWTKEELRKVIELAKTYQKWIISDEIHCDLVRKGIRHTPLAVVGEDYLDQIVVCTAPSKTFNLAGLQNSNIILHKDAYQKAWKEELLKSGIQSPNVFAQTATKAAYDWGENWLQEVNRYIDENIRCAAAYLQQELPKAVISSCQGTYLMWVDLRAYCADKDKLERLMQKQANVIFDEGYLFGKSGEGFERINTACPRDILMEAVKRMADAIKVDI